MTWTAPAVTRIPMPTLGDERPHLQGWLDHHRQTLLLKCAGLTAEQLRTAAVEPSGLTLLGLVRHMAEVERWWFRRCFAGQQLADLYCSEASPDGDFDDLATADAEADLATFHREVELADQAAAGRDLTEEFTNARGRRLHLRWIYLHMIEEYARHNGHADLIRERIDGTTGT
jgi:uncharacterized damage-inducible protein DinB